MAKTTMSVKTLVCFLLSLFVACIGAAHADADASAVSHRFRAFRKLDGETGDSSPVDPQAAALLKLFKEIPEMKSIAESPETKRFFDNLQTRAVTTEDMKDFWQEVIKFTSPEEFEREFPKVLKDEEIMKPIRQALAAFSKENPTFKEGMVTLLTTALQQDGNWDKAPLEAVLAEITYGDD